MKKWIVEEDPEQSFDNSHGEITRVFVVRFYTWPSWEFVHVWHDKDGSRCVNCSGQLVAMRKDCPHARAVTRHLEDNE